MPDNGYQDQGHSLDAGRVALALRGVRPTGGHYPFVAREQRRRQRRRRARARQKLWQTRSRSALAYLIALSVAGWMMIRLGFVPVHLFAR
jgi:hypothetical protein